MILFSASRNGPHCQGSWLIGPLLAVHAPVNGNTIGLVFITPISMPYCIRASINTHIFSRCVLFAADICYRPFHKVKSQPLVMRLDFSSTLGYATHIPVTRNSVKNWTWLLHWDDIRVFNSDNWQAILRRNLHVPRSKLQGKASCTTCSPESESTHPHGYCI